MSSMDSWRKKLGGNKDQLYAQLEKEITLTPDVLMVMGDLNAKVGGDNTGRKRVMGTQGFGCINNNGEKLSELCMNQKITKTLAGGFRNSEVPVKNVNENGNVITGVAEQTQR